MLDKFLNNKTVSKVLTLVLVVSLLLAAGSVAYPMARKAVLVEQLGTQNLQGTQVLAKTISYLEGDTISILSEGPAVTASYKRLSGLFTDVGSAIAMGRVYAVAKSGSGFVYLLDSNYCENAKPGADYYLPGSTYGGPAATGAQSLVDKVFDGRLPHGFTKDIITLNDGEHVIACAAPITDSFGKTVGVLIIEVPAGNADFTKLGVIDFNVLAIVFGALFGVALLLLILLNRWRQARLKRQGEKNIKKAEEEKQQLEKELLAKQEELEKLKKAEEQKTAEKSKATESPKTAEKTPELSTVEAAPEALPSPPEVKAEAVPEDTKEEQPKE